MKKVFKTAAFLLAMGLMTSTFTSCGEDDGNGDEPVSVAESVKASNIVAVVSKDGKITVKGNVTANTKIKAFGLSSTEDGKSCDIADFTKSESWNQIKDKGEDGKEFNAEFSGVKADITYPCYLVIKTKGDKVIHEEITKQATLEVGTGSNQDLGSYVSIKKQKAYLISEVSEGTKGSRTPKAAAADVEVVLKGEGASASFEVANTSEIVKNNPAMKDAFNKCWINNGVIVAEDGCAATFTAQKGAADNVVTINFTVIGLEGSSIKVEPASDITLSK
jgi:hypothetical protein